MKKSFSIILSFLLVLSFAACSKVQTNNTKTATKQIESQTTTTTTTQSTKETTSETTAKATTKKSNKDNSDDKKISMNINGEEVIISLDDTPAANSFYDMLPLDVDFKNFNSEEKMMSVEKIMENADKPEAPSLDIGNFGLSEEDGSLYVITGDKESENSFNKLGTIVSGLDIILKQTGDYSATIKKV